MSQTQAEKLAVDYQHIGHQDECTVVPLRAPSRGVDEDLRHLAAIMPENYREIFCLRFGLGQRRHTLAQIGAIVGLTPGNVRSRLEVCLWNCHRAAQHEDLPAIRRLLGPDRKNWVAQAWSQSARWVEVGSRITETRLLLAIAGEDIYEIPQIIGEHIYRLGLSTTNPWGTPLTTRQRARRAEPVIDRVLDHTIWPERGPRPWEPGYFCAKREPTAKWERTTYRGYFHSQKLDRTVAYDSTLEHEMLRHLDADNRVIEIIEQPFTIPATFSGRQHLYTPDVIVRLADGRIFVIEVKGEVRLGEFAHWMRWTALARYCELNGYGLYIGNTQTGSIIDHYRASHSSPLRPLVRALAIQGTPPGSDNHLTLQAEDQMLVAQAVTAETLAWTPGTKGSITRPQRIELEKARGFWLLVASHCARSSPVSASSPESLVDIRRAP